MPKDNSCTLSICIATFNRASFIGATLESIIGQATIDCEILVLDGGSTDDTERVVGECARRCSCLRYVKQNVNNGIDRDYDRAVELARGEYCWLMSDDDLLKPGAIASVINALRRDVSLVIVNMEHRDFGMTTVVQRSFVDFSTDRMYEPEEMDRLFSDAGVIVGLIACIVIKRSIWLERERQRYFGSLFVHVGVIFQERLPERTLVIAEPFISYRTGNTHTFSPRMFEVNMFKWPSLVWSLPLSELTKAKLCDAEPWRSFERLLLYRAMGCYSLVEYRLLVRPRLCSIRESFIPTLAALFPGVLANLIFVSYYSLTGHHKGAWLQALRHSRFYVRHWTGFRRVS